MKIFYVRRNQEFKDTMLNKFFRLITVFFFLIFFLGCSFDNKTGIWEGEKKSKLAKEKNTKIIKLSNFQNEIESEINTKLKINLESKEIKNNNWSMSGLNYKNFIGHLEFNGKINKFSEYKFEKIKKNAIKENPLIVKDNYFITIDDEGSVLKFFNKNQLTSILNFIYLFLRKLCSSVSCAIE